MGMFDWVDRPPVKCPKCGRELNEFQSKSGFCRLLHVTPEQLIEDSYRSSSNSLIDYDIVEYYDYCLENGCEGAVFFYYDPNKPESGWEVEYRTERS